MTFWTRVELPELIPITVIHSVYCRVIDPNRSKWLVTHPRPAISIRFLIEMRAWTIIGAIQENMTWVFSCSSIQIAHCNSWTIAIPSKNSFYILTTVNSIISLSRAWESLSDWRIWARNTIVYVLLMCSGSTGYIILPQNLGKSTAVGC